MESRVDRSRQIVVPVLELTFTIEDAKKLFEEIRPFYNKLDLSGNGILASVHVKARDFVRSERD
jgi:hypothetical protein